MENVLDVVTENGLILFDQETWDIDNSITLRCREPSRIPYHNEFRWSTGKLEFGLKWAAKDFATFVIIFLSVFLAFRATYRWKLSTWNVVLFERSVFQCWWWDIMCIYRFNQVKHSCWEYFIYTSQHTFVKNYFLTWKWTNYNCANS